MVHLSDAELEIVMSAAAPLEPDQRSQFLERMAAELAAMPPAERGVGSMARLCRELQHEHWSAPADERPRPSKWARVRKRATAPGHP